MHGDLPSTLLFRTLAWKWVLLCLRLYPSFRTEVVNQALLWQFPGAKGMVKLYRSLSLCQNSLWGMPDVSTALGSVHPNRFFQSASSLGLCLLFSPALFHFAMCIYAFRLSRSLLISLEGSCDALNIYGAQRHLHALSASIFRQASTLFELPFFKAPTVCYWTESSGCHTIMQFYNRAGLATSQCVNNTLLSLFLHLDLSSNALVGIHLNHSVDVGDILKWAAEH